ncbi:PREDICTED: nicotinamide mononucleotide adenylyltransferase-like isoform X5 [Populus euphratica]|uniref:Nicotinamide mononucleotide adenylyltransferase-like isoform X5 n=1 Tax=Populus euphratica TaxID=75702 RepID=A0AAJ6U6B6_POPEU|nr:PREDICTED: nicotinamide mononucleotide adenylyltransferase-like isoform X5 [Populus euphratica]
MLVSHCHSDIMDPQLPMEKVSFGPNSTEENNKINVVLVATGSFNPPTFMHLRLFELARDTLQSEGYHVIAAYMSPVNDAYKKAGLISGEHRLQMCSLACESSDFVMVDQWESFSIPGFWNRDHVRTICSNYGVVCIRREGQVIKKIVSDDEILNENKGNIRVTNDLVPNQISSTRVRECISRGLSIKYLTADGVIDYIREKGLYLN